MCHGHALLCLVSFLLVPLTLGPRDLGNYCRHFSLFFLTFCLYFSTSFCYFRLLYQHFSCLVRVVQTIIVPILYLLYVFCSLPISFSAFLLHGCLGYFFHFLVYSGLDSLSCNFQLLVPRYFALYLLFLSS